jgi:hypothetical protein
MSVTTPILRKIEQVYMKQAPAVDDVSRRPPPVKITFIDNGQNWSDTKAHPREVIIISGAKDTPELRAEICADIRRGQGYTGIKVTSEMKF